MDTRAMYLRTMVSPHQDRHGNKYKLSYGRHTAGMDIYSQIPEPDVDDYLEDSFCVDEEEGDETG